MSSPDYSQAVKDIIDGLGDSPTPDAIYHAVRSYSVDHVVAAAAAAAKAGGSQPVSCTLACDTDFDVHSIGNYDVLWDALYDNLWDLNPLGAIPDGLGLAFSFDGSSSLVVPTEAGIWSLSYVAARVRDISLGCTLRNGGVGIDFPWVQPIENVTDTAAPFLASSQTLPLPAGTQMTHQVATVHGGANNPSNVTQVYLSIVRHA